MGHFQLRIVCDRNDCVLAYRGQDNVELGFVRNRLKRKNAAAVIIGEQTKALHWNLGFVEISAPILVIIRLENDYLSVFALPLRSAVGLGAFALGIALNRKIIGKSCTWRFVLTACVAPAD